MMNAKADFKKAREAALKILNDGGYTEPPIDPRKIAQDAGIEVLFANFDNEYSEISGFYDSRESKEIIYVNNEELPTRQMFPIAHELGHKFLHEDWIKSNDYKVLYRKQLNDLTSEKDPKEQEADCFATHLLVPKFILDKYRDVATIDDLSTLFVVSRPVIKNRLSSLVYER